jgi:Putative transposase, YhgA-like
LFKYFIAKGLIDYFLENWYFRFLNYNHKQMEIKIPNPHDKFFKESFSRIDVVRSFIEEVFPDYLRDNINLDSLQLPNASFVDDMLKENFADLVYEAEYEGVKASIALLFEHKSYQENFPEWQLMRYMTNIWGEEQKQSSEDDKKKKSKQPSLVIPVTIHHGETAWKKKSMRSYFGNPPAELFRFLPEFDYLLFSLNDFEDYQIANFKNDFLATAAMLLKHSRDEKEKFLLIENFLIEKLRTFDLSHEEGYITTIAFYLYSASNLTTNQLIIIFTKVSNSLNKIAMTPADEIRQETMETFYFNTIKGLIKNGASIEFIAKSFEISVQKVEEVVNKIKASYN